MELIDWGLFHERLTVRARCCPWCTRYCARGWENKEKGGTSHLRSGLPALVARGPGQLDDDDGCRVLTLGQVAC